MSTTRSASLCTFTFADGRRCRTPRSSGNPQFCCFHSRKQAQAQAAEDIGRDIAYFFSGRYLSACDLNAALGRLFTAAAQGHVKPRTAGTLAYLAQVMVQCIQLTQKEYGSAFGGDGWRNSIRSSVDSNSDYLNPPPPQPPAPSSSQAPQPVAVPPPATPSTVAPQAASPTPPQPAPAPSSVAVPDPKPEPSVPAKTPPAIAPSPESTPPSRPNTSPPGSAPVGANIPPSQTPRLDSTARMEPRLPTPAQRRRSWRLRT
jgi:hypothetical protein